MLEILITILYTVGLLALTWSAFKTYLIDDERKHTIYRRILILGGILLFIALGIGTYQKSIKEKEFLAKLSAELNVTADEIIIKDLSERKFLDRTQNPNLKQVYTNESTYLVELKENGGFIFLEIMPE